jgi:predicted permease
VTLTVGVGVNLIVFTIVDALWLKPLPFRHPDRLVSITTDDAGPGEGIAFVRLDPATWRPFEAVAGQVITTGHSRGLQPHIVFGGIGRRIEAIGVTPEYFGLFGLSVRGRDFRAADNHPGSEPVAIISDRLWSHDFRGRPDVIGQVVPASPVPLRIIGIAPPGFEGARRGEKVDVWIPSNLVAQITEVETVPLMVFGRLYPGQTSLDAARGLVQTAQDERTRLVMKRIAVVPLKDVFGTPESRTIIIREVGSLRLVAGLAMLVLLGGCATLMALVLVHYERRRRELGVRMALGASRARLICELSWEMGALILAGAGGAVFLAVWGLHAIPSFTTPGSVDIGRLDLHLDWRVVGVAIGATAVTMFGAVLLPISRCTHASVATELVGSGTTTASANSHRVRQVLLGLHVCATIVILVASGLFVRAVVRGFGRGAGFDADRTVFATVQLLSPSRTVGPIDVELQKIRARTIRVTEALRSLPGVEDLAEGAAPIGPNEAATLVPYSVGTGDEHKDLLVGKMAGSAQLLRTLGVEIIAGRALTEADSKVSPAPAILTASLAHRLWPDSNPLGRVISFAGRGGSYVVVGISGDFVFGSFSRPAAGVLVVAGQGAFGIEPQFALRGRHPDSLVDPIERTILASLPDVPWLKVETGQTIIARDMGRQRLGAWFFSGFGLSALILSIGGVFGLVAYLAESRKREFSVRLALGATWRALVLHALRAAIIPVSVGVAAGLVLSAIIGRVFTSLLSGLSPVDPLTYGAVAITMLGTAVIAGLGAAYRLRFTAPADALRAE